MTLGDTLGNAQALVDMLSDTVLEMKEKSLDNTRCGAWALVDTWADMVAEVEAVIPGDRPGNAQALNVLLGDT